MEINYADKFASFYEEHADTYQDDIELALSDFKGFEGIDNDDTYGFFEGVKSAASTAGSAIKTGAKTVGRVAGSLAKEAGGHFKDAATTAGKITGITSLKNTVKNAATGAVVGAGVNAVRGKSITKGAVAGATINTVGRAAVNTVGNAGAGMYNKVKERFSDEDYSDLDEDAMNFVNFYSEMEDIYGENMEEAYSDFEAIYVTDNFSSKAWNKAGDIAKSNTGRIAIGALAASAVAQGITSTGTEALMRRQLKKKLVDGTISINERAQLRDLINSRKKYKKSAAIIGGGLGYFAK